MVDLMRFATVVGLTRQQMHFWMLETGIGEDQSVRIRKGDKVVAIF